jgi:thiol-disulfide isomerase/thioredoxin
MSLAQRLLFLPLFALALASGAVAQTLTVGDQAPPLKVSKWLKGGPIELGKKIQVVEFWATWCPPCLEAMPHLSAMARKYKDKVDFLGVNVWEEPEAKDNAYIAEVEEFVQKMGDKMDYRVAADGIEGVMTKTWLDAAGIKGIPAAFIVDQNKKILWIGNPHQGLEKILDQMIAGTFDVEKAKKEHTKAQMLERVSEKLAEGMNDFIRRDDLKGAIGFVEKMILDEGDTDGLLESTRFSLLLYDDEAKAFAYGRELLVGKLKDNAEMLNSLAWMIVEDVDVYEKPDYKLALEMASHANELTKEEDPNILDTLALAYYRDKQPGLALVTQEKAIKLAEADKTYEEDILKEMKERLELFKKG